MTTTKAKQESLPIEAIPVEQQTSLLQVIERVAMNPDADLDKMERLLQMKERLDAKTAEQSFTTSLVAAQQDMRPIAADAENPQTKSKYASYAQLDRALRPIYTQHGFALSFDTGDATTEGMVRVQCYVAHSDGHSRTHHVDMPADGKGAKGAAVMTQTHATGAAMTYGMRYLLKMIFNVAVGEDDTDGNMPQAEPITEEQVTELEDMIMKGGINRDNVIKWLQKAMNVESIADLNQNGYEETKRTIEANIKNKGKKNETA